jgi:alkaline phosphatase D
MLSDIQTHAPNRTVVITGDIHSSWVNELHAGFSRPDRPTIAAEFVGTSITSGGDGSEQQARVTAVLSENPHLKWQNSRRGYVSCTVDSKSWTAEYRTFAFVSKPDCPVTTPTKWRVEHGRAGILGA